MKKGFYNKLSLTVLSLSLLACSSFAYAEDLLQVYKDALQNDPTFQQALANRDVSQAQIPLNLANLLPQLSGQEQASTGRTTQTASTSLVTGTEGAALGNQGYAQQGLTLELTLSQSVFNWTYWANLVAARNTVKAAYATYTAAIQDLIQRTAQAYFNVLQAEDNLTYTTAEKTAFYNQYIQAKESYEVGVKTITDVYNAKASYDSSVAQYVAAVNGLADAKEALAAITGRYYTHLNPLIHLPLITPQPNNIETWTNTSISHNWQLAAAHYSMFAAHDQISAAEGGHLPNLAFQGQYENTASKQINQSSPESTRQKQLTGTLDLTVPIYSGGQVSAQVQQAVAQYDLSSGQFQSTYRSVVEGTRQDFLGVISGISKVQADQQAVISQQSSLEGTQEGYRVGTRTIIDVLNVETNLYNALKQNATDRYAYVMSLINLKQNAGTLDVDDLAKVNNWLGNKSARKSWPTNTVTKPSAPTNSPIMGGVSPMPSPEPLMTDVDKAASPATLLNSSSTTTSEPYVPTTQATSTTPTAAGSTMPSPSKASGTSTTTSTITSTSNTTNTSAIPNSTPPNSAAPNNTPPSQ